MLKAPAVWRVFAKKLESLRPAALLAAALGLGPRLREAAARAVRAARGFGWLDWAELASGVVVAGVFLLWARTWYLGNVPALWDPLLQCDDARTAIFPFHRYSAGAPLGDDPIATEMLEYQPYAYRLIFRICVPLVGVFYSTKVVQAILIGIVLYSGLVLALSPRAGLGAGILWSFFFIHDQYVQNRILGGLPRGFGFPLAALWIAGAIAARPNVRRASALLAALTYPTALAMVLAAEGLHTLRRLGFPGFWTALRRVRNYAALVAACGALLAPAMVFGMSQGGPIHTLEQAKREPAFTARLKILPFGDPGKEFGTTLVQAYSHYREGVSPFPTFKSYLDDYEHELAMALFALFILLPLLGFSGGASAVLQFLVANLVLYVASRYFAFKLYSPERYYSVGMRAVALALAASSLGLVAPGLRSRARYLVRNLVSALALCFVWFGIGDGVRIPPMGVTIDYRNEAELWGVIKRLPQNTRIATHPLDAEDIPLFTARANNGTAETLQPWLTLSWKRQKKRAEDTLSAMYATDRAALFEFAAQYKVTHVLVNRSRYHQDFRARSRSFEPFTSFASDLLSGKKLEDLVLQAVPSSAVVYKQHAWQLIDLARLKAEWDAAPGQPAPAGDADDAEEAEPNPKAAPAPSEAEE